MLPAQPTNCSNIRTQLLPACNLSSASTAAMLTLPRHHRQQHCHHEQHDAIAAAYTVPSVVSPQVQAPRCRTIAAAVPARKQQQQQRADEDAADDSWYTSSSSSSSTASPSRDDSSSSSSGSSKRPASSAGRGRFSRAGSTGATAGSRRSATAAGPKAASRTASKQARPSSQPAAAAAAIADAQAGSTAPHQPAASEQPQPATLHHVQQQQQQQQQQQPEALSLPPPSAQLTASQIEQLQRYLDHLLEVNKSMNLTAIRDPEEAWQRHIEDSLALLPVIEQHAPSSSSSSRSSRSSRSSSSGGRLTLIDVGTGAGLPGMVLAVVRQEWQVTLLDSLRKRCDFLTQTAAMLGLSNVQVVWSRAEDAARQTDLRDGHDVAVARAVADMRLLSEFCLPFVRPGGVWVAAKGANPEDEVAAARKALSKLQGRLVAVPRVQSWAPEGQRTAVVVAKTGPTPKDYPRPPGTPGKKPL